ncbi:hypothetical protein Tco_0350171 [Tanacetum coccineum]
MLNQAASTSAKPPTKNDWDVPFQPINVEEPHNEEVAEFDSDTFTSPFALPDTSSAESSSRIIDTSNMHTF